MSPDDLTGALCADGGALLHWVLGLLALSSASSLAANIRHRLPSWAVKIIDALALNFWASFRKAAVEAAKSGAGVLLLVVLAVGLTACMAPPATMRTSSAADPLAGLTKFTIADLQAAETDAQAHGDEVASACYQALIPFVQQLSQANAAAKVAGAVSALQRTRDITNGVRNGLPANVQLGCGGLVVDEQTLIAKLSAIAAGSAAVSGAIFPIPVLPAAP